MIILLSTTMRNIKISSACLYLDEFAGAHHGEVGEDRHVGEVGVGQAGAHHGVLQAGELAVLQHRGGERSGGWLGHNLSVIDGEVVLLLVKAGQVDGLDVVDVDHRRHRGRLVQELVEHDLRLSDRAAWEEVVVWLLVFWRFGFFSRPGTAGVGSKISSSLVTKSWQEIV